MYVVSEPKKIWRKHSNQNVLPEIMKKQVILKTYYISIKGI